MNNELERMLKEAVRA